MLVSKKDLRKKLLRERKSLQPQDRKRRDLIIASRLVSLEEFKKANKVLLYYPVRGEPDIRPLFYRLLDSGKMPILPKVSGPELKLISFTGLSCLRKGAFGIPEPFVGEEFPAEELELVVVPGIAFDRRGFRLGFGKGYYDRLLKVVKAPKVGVAYSFQVVEYIPEDGWDIPVDILITDKEVMRWKR